MILYLFFFKYFSYNQWFNLLNIYLDKNKPIKLPQNIPMKPFFLKSL